MSDLIVLDVRAAARRRRSGARSPSSMPRGGARVIDSAVLSRDAAGELHVHEQVASGTEAGAAGGGALGLLIGVMFPPLGFR